MSLPREGSRDTEEGILVSIYPDVCLTPSGASMVPVPYTIWAKQSDDANTTPTVRYTSLRTHNMGSLITTCHGDEAGTGGGVMSGTHNGICEPMEHSATVRTEGKNAIRHNDIWWMNNKNTQGRLTYVKEPDATSLTPQSQNDWTGFRAQEPSVDPAKGNILSDAAPDPILAGQQYAQANPAPLPDPAPAPMPAPSAPTNNVIEGPWTRPAAAAAPEAEGWGSFLLRTAPLRMLGAIGLLLSLSGDTDERTRRQYTKPQPTGRTDGNLNVSPQPRKPKDEICDAACKCKKDRGGARTFTECVAKRLREKYYDPNGPKGPDGSPRYPKSPTADGPRPEVSYDPNNNFLPAPSTNSPGMPSSQVPISGMPRPDISWWSGGQLSKIYELKFGNDTDTRMQAEGYYRDIARANGLDPNSDLVRIDVDKDCECGPDGGSAK